MFRFRESDLFSPAERAALELAEAMTQTPPKVTDDLFQRLGEHYSEASIVELTAVVALENFRARFNRGLGVEAVRIYPRWGELMAAAGLPMSTDQG